MLSSELLLAPSLDRESGERSLGLRRGRGARPDLRESPSCPHAEGELTRREQPGETKDLETDPTLQRSPIQCSHCGQHGAVFYQDQAKRQTTNMTLFYYCVHCKHLFRDPKVKTR